MGKQKRPPARRYFVVSRRLAASYVFVAPLVGLYELGVVLDERARNGADGLFRDLFDRFSQAGMLAINMFLLGLLFLAIWRTKDKRLHTPGLYGYMLLESCAWAALMLVIAAFWPQRPLTLPLWGREIVASIGAGIYEEAVFRFLLLGGIVVVFHHLLHGHPAWVVPVAIGASAVLFSWAHHAIGLDPWNPGVFFFRAVMGALLGALYWARGLGVVVYAHALYNVALLARHA